MAFNPVEPIVATTYHRSVQVSPAKHWKSVKDATSWEDAMGLNEGDDITPVLEHEWQRWVNWETVARIEQVN